jgi:dipeptidyl aminopeptidase/acylaminoacyl peptidase
MAAYPAVNFGFVYVRARYGVNLWDASPANALRGNHVPVLLIHGAADTNIDPRHSRALHAANPANTELWEVPGAAHVASLGASRQQYIRRVTTWFP